MYSDAVVDWVVVISIFNKVYKCFINIKCIYVQSWYKVDVLCVGQKTLLRVCTLPKVFSYISKLESFEICLVAGLFHSNKELSMEQM